MDNSSLRYVAWRNSRLNKQSRQRSSTANTAHVITFSTDQVKADEMIQDFAWSKGRYVKSPNEESTNEESPMSKTPKIQKIRQ